MSRKIVASILFMAGVTCCLAGFEWSRASAQVVGQIVPNTACYERDCRQFNWAGVQAYDSAGNPIPAGSTCNINVNQNTRLCAQTANTNCLAKGPGYTCAGWYLNANGDVVTCS